MSEHIHEDDLEERDDVVERNAPEDSEEPGEGEPWAKTTSGNADEITDS
jgi:hypothetical protein